jgi:hypothetical protein
MRLSKNAGNRGKENSIVSKNVAWIPSRFMKLSQQYFRCATPEKGTPVAAAGMTIILQSDFQYLQPQWVGSTGKSYFREMITGVHRRPNPGRRR